MATKFLRTIVKIKLPWEGIWVKEFLHSNWWHKVRSQNNFWMGSASDYFSLQFKTFNTRWQLHCFFIDCQRLVVSSIWSVVQLQLHQSINTISARVDNFLNAVAQTIIFRFFRLSLRGMWLRNITFLNMTFNAFVSLNYCGLIFRFLIDNSFLKEFF